MVVPLLSQEQLSDGIREAPGSQQPMTDWHSLARYEQEIAKAINENTLILLENLLSLGKKLEENSRRERSGATAADGQHREEERRRRRQAEEEKGWRENRLPPAEEQKTGSVRRRETVTQGKGEQDTKHQRKKQDSWKNDRMRKTHEGRSRGDARETREGKPQSKIDKNGVPQEIISHQRMEDGELNRQRWNSVKDQSRRRGGDDIDITVAGETKVRSQHEKEKAKDREQNRSRKVDEEWTGEKRHKEQSSKDKYGSNDDTRKQGAPHKRQQKSASRLEAENHSGKGRASGEPLLTPGSGSSQSSRLQQAELDPEGADSSHKRLPCNICHRCFWADRLETHIKICERTHQAQRKVFNSSHHRTKGTSLEEFLRTHPRSKTPERKSRRHNSEVLTRNTRQDRLAGGASDPNPSVQPNPDYETCPHCSRRFSPKAAQRHISKCEHIKSRPPPPRCRQ
ncbi:zinc finger C2HC domain-containing protein 1C isoform X2 [Myripristis murdjan]|nr:zinc finger C2HC domain-containing protein 1C isoform X2 [Myripristis murdjan]XP_029900963.1 zinc finger C2HC domain-containing protein 1C isoform X2 [Myripristis murdjan]XP_029900964.1 zinc finger C2HC domain-containing protein 1C isoform X2 [Myripristis murdjan]